MTELDAEQLCAIYNYFIKNSVITFEEEEINKDEMVRRFNEVTLKYPWIVYEENDINVHFVRGIIDMFSENNIFIKSPLNNEEEKVFNNQKIFIKHPFLKALTYNPYEKEDLDILFIFSKDSFEKKYLINDYLSYDEHIKHLIEQNENAICVYIQYNDVYFEVDNIKNRFITIFNAPQESELHLLNKFYMGKNVETYCLDLNELIFSNRISNKENVCNKVFL